MAPEGYYPITVSTSNVDPYLGGIPSDETSNLKRKPEWNIFLPEIFSDEEIASSQNIPSPRFIPPYPLTQEHYKHIDSKAREMLESQSSLLSELLESYIKILEHYFRSIGKQFDFWITLQEDPEDPEFWVFLIVINTPYKDIDEKLELTLELGDRLDEVTQDFHKNRKNKNVIGASSSITFRIEKGKYE